jgi:hypothetical protein
MVFREFIKHKFQFLAEVVLRIITIILCCGMNIQNNDILCVTSYHYQTQPS